MAAKKPIQHFMQAAYRHGEMREPQRHFGLQTRTLALAGIALLILCLIVGTWWFFHQAQLQPAAAQEIGDAKPGAVKPWEMEPLPLQEAPGTGNHLEPSVEAAPGEGASGEGENLGQGGGVADLEEIVLVHIAGAVQKPGVVRLSMHARAIDAVEEAGGFTPAADGTRINLAAFVADGDYLYVPSQGEELPPDLPATAGGAKANGGDGAGGNAGGSAGQGNVGSGKVILNSATVAELETLSGVGPVLAERIIAWREDQGPFTDVSQLMNVSGIGPAKFNQIKDQVEL